MSLKVEHYAKHKLEKSFEQIAFKYQVNLKHY